MSQITYKVVTKEFISEEHFSIDTYETAFLCEMGLNNWQLINIIERHAWLTQASYEGVKRTYYFSKPRV